MEPFEAPPSGTIERWAFDVIRTLDFEAKLAPPPAPADFEQGAPSRRMDAPSRPSPLQVVTRAPKTPRAGALERAEVRARQLHVFLHHELQAAELFCWALLAFPETPESFRRGLLKISSDELRHARMYRAQIERLGARFGDFPVRDWFWERFVQCESATTFVALMGIGFEGGNLDHCANWAQRFRAVGDEESARCQEAIGREEIEHVAFATHWYERWNGQLEFDAWRAHLPQPLTPTLMHGKPLARTARSAAGLDEDFQNHMEQWDNVALGS